MFNVGDEITMANDGKLKEFSPYELYKPKTQRLLLSSVALPSQYSSYAICVEFMKNWFLEKFPEHYFNSIYVEGSHSFDEFRKFSDINQQLKRSNPLLAIIPEIDMSYNRDFIDSNPELGSYFRRSKMEGVFFSDIRDNRGLHLQIQFKTIKMTCVFKIRTDTKGEQLDMIEFIKFKHRAGYTESRNLCLDIHVPRQIISQIAFDNDIPIYDNGYPVDSVQMLSYLNSHSYIPFIHKLRCATGNNEYFIKVPNCVGRIKSEFPQGDGGDRQDTLTTNYNIDFGIEVEMTAPYCYTYYSQKEHDFIKDTIKLNENTTHICIMQSVNTQIPIEDERHWKMITDEAVQYEIDTEDLDKEVDIDFTEYFAGTDLGDVVEYSKKIFVSPFTFLNFKIFNSGGEVEWDMNWENYKMHVKQPAKSNTFLIAIYCDNGYFNNTLINIKEINNSSRV